MTFISYAQNYEDVMLWRALKHVKKGVYVDVGANDPFTDSVTQAFYERGWQGINIEPMFSYYERLCSARPLDTNLPVAAANEEGELTLYEIPETGLSTLDKEIAEKQRSAGWVVNEHNVPVFTLDKIFEKYINGPIHFLKIDVEGYEKQVLEGANLSRWRPWIMVIEATKPLSSEPNFDSWESIVLAAEYELVYLDGINRFYIAKEQSALAEVFKTPPNFFDNFISDGHYYAITEGDAMRSELVNIRTELDAVRAERDNLKSILDAVYRSRSWRMLARIRKVLSIRSTFRRIAQRFLNK